MQYIYIYIYIYKIVVLLFITIGITVDFNFILFYDNIYALKYSKPVALLHY